MRLLALTGVVLVALVGASTAQAHHLTGSPVVSGSPAAVTTDAWAELIDRAVRPTTPTPITAPQTSVDSLTWRMRMAGRILPKLSTLGTISLGAAAFGLGWQIGGAAQPTIFNLLTGDIGTSPSLGSGEGPIRWALNVSTSLNDANYEPDPPDPDFWRLRSTSCVLFYNPPASGSGCADDVDAAGFAAAAEAGATAHVYQPDIPLGQTGFTLTAAEMEAKIQLEPVDSTAYSAYGGTKTTTSYDAPGDLGTAADKQAAAALLGSAGSQTAVQQATEEALCTEAGLSGCDPVTIALPQPTINETYPAYILRLEALGWIGTATTTATTAEHPGYGPEAPVRIIVTEHGAVATRTIDPLAWPAAAVNIDPDSDITIRYNPETAPEAPGETGTVPTTGTGTTVTWPDTTVPAAPSVDFSPVTDIDFGCKFPYGFLCYAVDFTEQFDVAADAPVFTFDMEMDVALGSFDLGTYEVDLEVMDAWMALWRDILSVVMVVGAIYFVATRMLGFKAGGDPGAAMDDVL